MSRDTPRWRREMPGFSNHESNEYHESHSTESIADGDLARSLVRRLESNPASFAIDHQLGPRSSKRFQILVGYGTAVEVQILRNRQRLQQLEVLRSERDASDWPNSRSREFGVRIT
jgi:hypothetical protein